MTPSKDTVFQVLHPRIGGLLQVEASLVEAWTGGSNIHPNTPVPDFDTQRRPLKASAMNDLVTLFKKGTELKLKAPGKKGDQPMHTSEMSDWFTHLNSKATHFGLDTCFKAPNSTFTAECNLSVDWGKATLELVEA